MNIRINRLDSKFSKVIRYKRPLCEVCSKQATQVHHFKGRRNQGVRYDPDNIWSLCFGCHRRFHEDPAWAVEMQKERLGVKYDGFILKANMICKRYKADKKLIEIWIDQELKQGGQSGSH